MVGGWERTERDWKNRGTNWIEGKTYSLWGQSSTRESCPNRLCKLSLWRFPRTAGTQTRTAWSDLVADPASSSRLHWWPPKAVPAWTVLSPVTIHTVYQLVISSGGSTNLGSLQKKKLKLLGVQECWHTCMCAYTYIHTHTRYFKDFWCNHNLLKNMYWVPCCDSCYTRIEVHRS